MHSCDSSASSARCGGSRARRCGCACMHPARRDSKASARSTGWSERRAIASATANMRRPHLRPDVRLMSDHPAPTSPPLLAARGLHYARNDVAVFGPLDFAVDTGEALLVQGDNGAGKTTLLRVLAGLLRADGGAIAIEGRDATPALRAGAVAYLGHLPALKADLTVLENLD